MPRSRRRQSKRRSAAERSPIKRASASGRHLQQPASATDSSVTSTATPLELDGSMADRYYAMAENMNTRGAMEMAVPFYRQAITLLLAERASLQQKLGGASAQPVAQELPWTSCMACLRPPKRWASPPPPQLPRPRMCVRRRHQPPQRDRDRRSRGSRSRRRSLSWPLSWARRMPCR